MYKIITVDGPAGVGKGTICELLSNSLNSPVLNSGEIYRGIAYNLKKNKISLNDIPSIIRYVKKYNHKKLSPNKLYNKSIDLISSQISSIPQLRKLTIQIQRNFVKLNRNASKMIIAEGRDMGTVIFPRAEIKIFLWAKVEIRAQRRLLQIKKSRKTSKFSDILDEVALRDMKDMSRKTAPLQPAEDSYLIDNSNLDIEQCFNRILKIIKRN
ncbi:(d)CMP kinase [Pelagibacterales bacterium]|nr:(d)CMP kinase [Pelagibacterales bacterium]